MKRFFSRFSRRYIRSLVYMLQASEYHIQDYLNWYSRAQDFSAVEKRKHIQWSVKARTLNVLAWMLVGFALAAAVLAAAVLPFPYDLFVVFSLTLGITYALPYALSGFVMLGGVIQKPLEQRLIRRAKETLRRHPAVKIAIAGSYGKTSMREILKTVLAEGKKVAAPPGSYNTPLGIASFVKTLTGDEEVIIFELGEYYPGDVRMLCEFVEPSMGVITGINEAHLEKFGTLERTADTIFELADHLSHRTVYVNADNAIADARATAGHIRFSLGAVGEWRVRNAKTGLEGTSFTLQHGTIEINAHSKLLGLHMVGLLAAAAHIAQGLGLTVNQIEKGIANTRAFSNRLEPKILSEGVVLLDDSYNGNPDGVHAVIAFLESLKGHRRFYVTPGLVEMGERKEAVHKEIGKELADAGIEHVILVRNSVTGFIEAGLKEAGFKGTLTWYNDGPSAYAALPHLTVPGDVVLIQNDWPDQYA